MKRLAGVAAVTAALLLVAVILITDRAGAETSDRCPDGYALEGDECVKTDASPIQPCPAGWTDTSPSATMRYCKHDGYLSSIGLVDAKKLAKAINTVEVPKDLIRTIREGQGVTYTVPIPANRQVIKAKRDEPGVCVTGDNKGWAVEPYTNVPCRTSASNGAGTTFGVCNGPWTVEVLSRDSRVTGVGGRQIRVTTDADDALDDTGIIEVRYVLRGAMSVTWYGAHGSTPMTTEQECDLTKTVRVQVNPARRRGMSAAVSQFAPGNEWLDGTTTSNWECTQALLDYYAAQVPPIPPPCSLGDKVSTTTENEFPTPRGCRVVVTVSAGLKDSTNPANGYGSTACLTADQADHFEDTLAALDKVPEEFEVDDLPTCPEDSKDLLDEDKYDAGYRCVARN